MTSVLRSSSSRKLFSPCVQRLILKRFYNLPPEMQPIIGLEIHAQLNTKQKLFSCISAVTFLAKLTAAPVEQNDPPNTLVDYHDIGLPGSMPVLNKEAVFLAVRGALALGCAINLHSYFDRKHYFYKDLPSGYQITQQYQPLAVLGSLPVNPTDDTTGQLTSPFILAISRVQLEQDTAKTTSVPINAKEGANALLNQKPLSQFLIDHNRSSVPLIEIITPPILRSPAEAATAFAKVAEILRATGVTTGDLHWGAMRCDVNVSLGLNSPRTEIKNLFSVSAVRDATRCEIEELVRKYEKNIPIEASTKTWDGVTVQFLRAKKGEKDYRYLPDADLPPLVLSREFIDKTRESLPPLPDYIVTVLMDQPHNLDWNMAKRLSVNSSELAYYNNVKSLARNPKGMTICHWIMYNLAPLLTKHKIPLDKSPFEPTHMAELLVLLQKSTINVDGAKLLLNAYFESDPMTSKTNLPKPALYGTLLAHPLLETLLVQERGSGFLRKHIIEAIDTTKIKMKTDSPESLERLYMGLLMKRLRGEVDGDRGREILKEEMKKRLEFIPQGRMFKVRHRTLDEMKALEKKEREGA